MKHYASSRFWQSFERLPADVQDLSRKNFNIMKENPKHPSLRLKQIGLLWSARVGLHYRTLGLAVDGGIQWFWIGTHSDYDELVG